MNTVEVYSLPKLFFAHAYKTDTYNNYIKGSKGHMEISYISEGEVLYEIGDNSILARKGDILCFLEAVTVKASAFHSHHTVCALVDWDFLENNSHGLYLDCLSGEVEGTAEIRQLIDDIIYNFPLYESSAAKGAGKFLDILCKIDACNRKSKDLKLPGAFLYTEKAKKYIHRHIYKPITQTEIAEYLDITPEYLCNVFKKNQGITLMKYVNQLKLEGIKDIMNKEHIPLYKAAELFGYTDANYVSRLYKNLFGHNITDKVETLPDIL